MWKRLRRTERSRRRGFWSFFGSIERTATRRRLAHREDFFEIAILMIVELERIAGGIGRHDMGEAAKIARGDSHPERGRSLIERKQRVAGRDEREELERVSAEHPARRGGTDRIVKLAPLVEENYPHRT